MSTPRYKIAFDRDGVNGKQGSEIAYKRMSLFFFPKFIQDLPLQ